MCLTWRVFLTVFGFLCAFQLSKSEEQVDNTFVPTHQWKVVEAGQQIPPGLHVRHNFQTGRTEAKFLDPNERDLPSNTSPIILSDVPQPQTSVNQQDELLKQLPHIATVEQNISNVDKRFRSYAELKKEMASSQVAVKTDAEILTDIMHELRENPSSDRLRVLLEDLSYLLHQVDNGKLFAEEQGLNLLKKYFNYDFNEIQILAFSAFGAAVRGNAKAKIIALQDGLLSDLSKAISSLATVNHPQWRVISAGVSALSALLRHFPSAQKHFFTTNANNGFETQQPGFHLLNDVFSAQWATGEDERVYRRLQIQILCLIGDIHHDRMTAKRLAKTSGNEDQTKLWQLYKRLPFESELLASNWCDHLTSSLLVHLNSRAGSPAERDHDRLEKLLNVVIQLGESTCQLQLGDDSNRVRDQLVQVEQEYTVLAKDEQHGSPQDDTYFSDMRELVQKAILVITQSRYTDEL